MISPCILSANHKGEHAYVFVCGWGVCRLSLSWVGGVDLSVDPVQYVIWEEGKWSYLGSRGEKNGVEIQVTCYVLVNILCVWGLNKNKPSFHCFSWFCLNVILYHTARVEWEYSLEVIKPKCASFHIRGLYDALLCVYYIEYSFSQNLSHQAYESPNLVLTFKMWCDWFYCHSYPPPYHHPNSCLIYLIGPISAAYTVIACR